MDFIDFPHFSFLVGICYDLFIAFAEKNDKKTHGNETEKSVMEFCIKCKQKSSPVGELWQDYLL
ncbi:MAG: hypothetical protein IJD81_09680 [Oscillospiraceae bacterium]|nr:hypothetical protein [Oscillospiraceae bacterium]